MDGVDRHNVWAIILLDRLDQLVSVWHNHRTLILSAVLAILFAVRFALRSATRAKDPNSSSGPPSPRINGAEGEKIAPIECSNEKKEILKAGPKVVTGRKAVRRKEVSPETKLRTDSIQPVILYSTLTGTSQAIAESISATLQNPQSGTNRQPGSESPAFPSPIIKDIADIELDEWFIKGPDPLRSLAPTSSSFFYILVIPSYNIDSLIDTFLDHLKETHNDFRIDTAPLSSLVGYCVFGLGDKEGWPLVQDGFCSQAIEVDKWMARLTGNRRAYPLGMGDVKSDLKSTAAEWAQGVGNALKDIGTLGSLGEGVPGSGEAVESDEDDEEFPDTNPRKKRKTNQVADLEDVKPPSTLKANMPLPVDFTTSSTTTTADEFQPPTVKQMVPKDSPTHAALTKQGYTIIGSHSGVKICRWTKSALRGRGSCYKNSFYGIASHLCMETTPSLSCSNKCVFCWRHGTNPVATTWRWEVDPPETIFRGAKEGHYKKIKMLRGVPGVVASRFEEAMRIRHCALSLVGEPIFYPYINEFLSLLHAERISSFLVCNAQHPDQLAALHRVTQLYVSIDASNAESLRKIDRPLHRDFWARFLRCLDILREKRFLHRTVFRLTLVKGFNASASEIDGYADLVARGMPCFIEIKGVTYCGTSTSKAAGLTMQNVPFYEEVVEFVNALDTALAKRGLEYGVAAEHAHSCCVLVAERRFFINGRWCTRIDYEKFWELLEKEQRDAGQAGGEVERFKPEDYCAPTPEWALFGNGGFDPRDVRVDRKGRPKLIDSGGGGGAAAAAE
ncbi:MAG: hypothetical protein Q9160_000561 [Pyrenula sp. 1 TL-2023]